MKMRYLVLATLLFPFVEFWGFGLVSHRLGLLPSLALLIFTSFLGIALLKNEGRRFLDSLKKTGAATISRENTKSSLHIGIAGLLLAMPGFISDVVALYFLLPFAKSVLKGERALKPNATPPNVIDLTPEQWHETIDSPPTNPSLQKPRKPRKNA